MNPVYHPDGMVHRFRRVSRIPVSLSLDAETSLRGPRADVSPYLVATVAMPCCDGRAEAFMGPNTRIVAAYFPGTVETETGIW